MHLISRSISLRAHSKYPPKLFTFYFDSALRVVKRKGGGSKGVGRNGDGKSRSNIKEKMNVFASLWLFTALD
jgi:hypothetical protein